MKQSKIAYCKFTNEWLNPKTSTKIYYHELQMENGDIGTCGSVSANPPKFSVGSIVEYEIEGSKIKLISSSGDTKQNQMSSIYEPQRTNVGYGQKKYNKPYSSGAGVKAGKPSRTFQQEEFLGYAWSYAKDLVVAGKKAKDFKELNEIASMIYNRIGEMLNEEPKPVEDSISDINEFGKTDIKSGDDFI